MYKYSSFLLINKHLYYMCSMCKIFKHKLATSEGHITWILQQKLILNIKIIENKFFFFKYHSK